MRVPSIAKAAGCMPGIETPFHSHGKQSLPRQKSTSAATFQEFADELQP